MCKLHKLNVNSPKLSVMQSYALALAGFVFENGFFIYLLKFFLVLSVYFVKVNCLGFGLLVFFFFNSSLPSILLFLIRFNMANPNQKLLKEQTFPIVKLVKRTHPNKISKFTQLLFFLPPLSHIILKESSSASFRTSHPQPQAGPGQQHGFKFQLSVITEFKQ